MEQETISFENTKRLKRRKDQIRAAVGEAAWGELHLGAEGTLEELGRYLTKELNKQIYEFAEQQGISVYDVCLGYMPQYSSPRFDFGKADMMHMEVSLVPMPLELEKGGGYWKRKYYRLKQRLQDLIDAKEE